jgi:O-antigen ligase/polysaccharide polymerase Wzy-like membrane protein
VSTDAFRVRNAQFKSLGFLVGLIAVAVLSAALISSQPLVAIALPVLLVSAVLCTRRPAGAVTIAFLITGWYGSLAALFGLQARPGVDLVLGGLWIGGALAFLGTRRGARWLWPGVAACLGYLGLSLLEVFTAPSLDIGLRSFRLTGWYMLSFVVIGYAGWRQATYEKIARCMVVVAFVVGGYAALRWQIGPAKSEVSYAFFSGAGQFNYVDGQLKTIGSFASRHQLAFWTACMIPFCVALAMTFSGRWRWLAAAATALCTVGMLSTGVRAAVLGAVAGVLAVFVLYQLSRGFPGLHFGATVSAALAVVVLGSGVYLATGAKDSQHYSAIFHPSNDVSYQHRVSKWSAALRDINRHPFGQGLGTAGTLQQHGQTRYLNTASYGLDNAYLQIAYEQGFTVMVLFIGSLLLLLIGLARRAITCVERERAGLAIAAVGVLLSGMILFISGQYHQDLISLAVWFPVGIGVAQFASRSRAEDAAEASDSPIEDTTEPSRPPARVPAETLG